MTDAHTLPMPGDELKAEHMPGHWLLARLGKRVLRPGGREMTCRMIEALNIQPGDAVIEFAPGLGETARLTLKRNPASYTAVERDKDAAALVERFLHGPEQRCVVGFAEGTGPTGRSSHGRLRRSHALDAPFPAQNAGCSRSVEVIETRWALRHS